ncbi:MAG: hypothetical protein J6K29_04980 [Clostridia bacterium]|nr:hypothetical protein [Clostridia bacterium]
MKKTALLLLALLLAAALPLTGCELLEEPFPEDTETDSRILIDPEKTRPETEAPLTPEEEALVEIAAEALWNERRDLPGREYFRIDVSYGSNGNTNIYVDFELYIGSYRTWESYDVTLNANHEVTSISGGHHNYRQYLKGATPERIAAAETALAEELKAYGENHAGGYLSVDDEGWLCLSSEIIVYLDGPAHGEGGCGIDHDHVFINERICKPE